MPKAEGDAAGRGMASITSASTALCHIPANLSQRGSSPAQHPPISLEKNPKTKQKSNQIKALGWVSPGIRTEAVPSGQCCRTPRHDSESGPSPAWVAAAPGGDGEAPLPASVSPFLHLSPFLLKHRGHEAQRGLDFSFSPKAPLSYKTLGDSLVRWVSPSFPRSQASRSLLLSPLA